MRESNAAKSNFGHTDSAPDLVGAPLTLDFTVFEGAQSMTLGYLQKKYIFFLILLLFFIPGGDTLPFAKQL